LDNVSLKPGCVKCYVTEVKPGFNKFALKNILGDCDEQRTLGETLLNHTQCPRKEIDFIDEIPQAPPRAINVALQPVNLSLPQQLSRASPEEPNTRNPTANASTCDHPPDFVPYRPCHCPPLSSQWQGLQLLKTHHRFRRRPLKQQGETQRHRMLSRPNRWNGLLSISMFQNPLLSSLTVWNRMLSSPKLQNCMLISRSVRRRVISIPMRRHCLLSKPTRWHSLLSTPTHWHHLHRSPT
jgi:hypothetical protein